MEADLPSESLVSNVAPGLMGHMRRISSTSYKRLSTWGVEVQGIRPVEGGQGRDKNVGKIFFIYFCSANSLTSVATGMTASLIYDLNLLQAILSIIIINAIFAIPAAYLSTWGPKLGLRQMCQARYSFGYYGVFVPTILNLVSALGFMTLGCVVTGQALASSTNDHISWNTGIVITCLLSLLISFCGLNVLTWYMKVAWIPLSVTLIVAVGVGAKNFSTHNVPPASIRNVISYGSVLGGYMMSYTPYSSDYTVYLEPKSSSFYLFIVSYLGLAVPLTINQCLGATFAIAAKGVPSWSVSASSSTGDFLKTILEPTGRFGIFLLVLIGFSVGNIAVTMYSICLNFQLLSPTLSNIPRYFYSIVAAIVVLPLSLLVARKYNEAIANFLSVIGYWGSCFSAVVITEHLVIRSGREHSRSQAFNTNDPDSDSRSSLGTFKNYDISNWDQPKGLPAGIAAISACVLALALIIPCMGQTWFTGPIARKTGDIAFEVALFFTAIIYIPLRIMEKRLFLR